MEKKKIELNKVAEEAGNNMKSFFGKAKDGIVKVVDRNDDGSFDKDDVVIVAEKIGDAAKHTMAVMKEIAEEKGREIELSTLQPIFLEDLNNTDFYLTKLIRLADIDKRYSESEACQNAIGHMSSHKDLKIVNIFRHKMDMFGLSFYPDAESEVYYVDPSDRNRYIALEDYFNYLKIARIAELQKIAQDLGAKHFKVTYKEHKASFSSSKGKVKGMAKVLKEGATVDVERDLSSKEIVNVEVAAEMDCPGHEPIEPKLNYLQRDPSILSLVSLRMDDKSPVSHHKFTLELSTSSGIKEKDAIKIDAALKSMKINGTTTITSEVQNESRRIFEYEVDF